MNGAVVTPLTVMAVALGGAAGSVARFVCGVAFSSNNTLPFGTLFVNVCGALLIGVLAKQFAGVTEPSIWRFALMTGFCGGFTTFSALSIETLQLLQQGRASRAVAYVLLTLLVGLASTWIGYYVAPSRNG